MNLFQVTHETDAVGLPYKRCCCCSAEWPDLESFLTDRDVVLIGYQVNFVDLAKGLFLFNHSCGTTLAMAVDEISCLYNGPRFSAPLTGTPACSQQCLHCKDLRSCPASCECAYVREVLQIIKNWPKK